MTKYILEDGSLIEAASPLGIVEALRDGSRFAHDQSVEEYMRSFAYRYKTWSGHEIGWDNVEEFVGDLMRTGYLKEF